jgi:hypothetical protein
LITGGVDHFFDFPDCEDLSENSEERDADAAEFITADVSFKSPDLSTTRVFVFLEPFVGLEDDASNISGVEGKLIETLETRLRLL